METLVSAPITLNILKMKCTKKFWLCDIFYLPRERWQNYPLSLPFRCFSMWSSSQAVFFFSVAIDSCGNRHGGCQFKIWRIHCLLHLFHNGCWGLFIRTILRISKYACSFLPLCFRSYPKVTSCRMKQLLTMHSRRGMLNWCLVGLTLGVQGNKNSSLLCTIASVKPCGFPHLIMLSYLPGLSGLGNNAFTRPWKRQGVSILMFTIWMAFLWRR